MKKLVVHFSSSILLLLIIGFLCSCQEEQKPEKQFYYSPDFQATVNPKKATLNPNTPDDVALSISWDHVSFGSTLRGVPVVYHLTICADGVQGAICTSIITDQNNHGLTHNDLNFYLDPAGFGKFSLAKLSIKIRAKAETSFECEIADAITEHSEAIPYGSSGNFLPVHKPNQSAITTIS